MLRAERVVLAVVVVRSRVLDLTEFGRLPEALKTDFDEIFTMTHDFTSTLLILVKPQIG
ncbi:MAG: hypothetical protein ACPIOQ_06070 [Promethearchaeia archaeon]